MKKLRKKWMNLFFVLALIVGSAAALSGNSVTAYAVSDNVTMQLNDRYIDGSIDDNMEADFYSFTITAPGWVTITYQGWNIGVGTYEIYNHDQTTRYSSRCIEDSSDVSPKTDSTTLALEAGAYIVKVDTSSFWWSHTHTGNYKIKGSFSPAGNNEREPNNYFETAMPLGQGQLVTGFLSEQDRIDFYTFNLASPATVDFTLISRVYGMDISVWDKNFEEVKSETAWDGGESSPKTLSMQLNLAAGVHYIKCERSYDYTGRYQLKWSYAPTLVTGISIGGNKTVAAGSSFQLSAGVTPSNASNKKVDWSSSDTSVATVNASGKVSAKKTGCTTITAKAKDGSGKEASVTVLVKPKKMSMPKAKALGKKKVKVSWKKQSGAAKYQVQYATNKKFKSAKKWSFMNTGKQATKTLKKKGTYYFRVRCVGTVNGQNLNGAWSNSVKVKIK